MTRDFTGDFTRDFTAPLPASEVLERETRTHPPLIGGCRCVSVSPPLCLSSQVSQTNPCLPARPAASPSAARAILARHPEAVGPLPRGKIHSRVRKAALFPCECRFSF